MTLQITRPPQGGRIYLPTIAPSRARDLGCPKRFGAAHIERTVRKEEAWSPHLAYGNGFHAAMCALYEPTGRHPVSTRPVALLVRDAFADIHYPVLDLRHQDIEKATAAITNYREHDADIAHTLFVENDYRFSWGQSVGTPITFSARFDRIVVRPDQIEAARFIDYKTGKPGDVDMESAAVALLVARARFGARYPNQEMCYDFVGPEGLVERVVVTPDDVRHLWPRLRDRAVSILHHGDRSEAPGLICSFCPLRQKCRPQQATAQVEDLDSLFS